VTKSAETVLSSITTAKFETWVVRQTQNKDAPNDAHRMEAINKHNIEDLQLFNSSTVDWPCTSRKGHGQPSGKLSDTACRSEHTCPQHACKLWDKQNVFLKTTLTA